MTTRQTSDGTITYRNLRSLLVAFGSFPGSRLLETPCGAVFLDGGTASAYENYALADPDRCERSSRKEARSLVEEGLMFFAQSQRPHLWPIFPGVPVDLEGVLEDCGIKRDAVFFAMDADARASLQTMKDGAHDQAEAGVAWIEEMELARAWADAAWLGFDSEEPAPKSFVALARNAIEAPDLFPAAIHRDGEMAATGMLTTGGEAAGIYYVATLPAFRRMGLGRKIVRVLVEKALSVGYERICLLATPEGRPLYRRCGFREACEVGIRVCEVPSDCLARLR